MMPSRVRTAADIDCARAAPAKMASHTTSTSAYTSGFPPEAQAQLILGEICSGAVTFTSISRSGGGLTQGAVARGVDLLQAKRLIARDLPLSTRRSLEARYRVTDPYLQFWLRFIGPHLPEIERRRGDRITAMLHSSSPTPRGSREPASQRNGLPYPEMGPSRARRRCGARGVRNVTQTVSDPLRCGVGERRGVGVRRGASRLRRRRCQSHFHDPPR